MVTLSIESGMLSEYNFSCKCSILYVMKGRFAMNENMNKEDYINAIVEMLEKSDDNVMLEFLFQLLNKAA